MDLADCESWLLASMQKVPTRIGMRFTYYGTPKTIDFPIKEAKLYIHASWYGPGMDHNYKYLYAYKVKDEKEGAEAQSAPTKQEDKDGGCAQSAPTKQEDKESKDVESEDTWQIDISQQVSLGYGGGVEHMEKESYTTTTKGAFKYLCQYIKYHLSKYHSISLKPTIVYDYISDTRGGHRSNDLYFPDLENSWFGVPKDWTQRVFTHNSWNADLGMIAEMEIKPKEKDETSVESAPRERETEST